MDITDNSNDKTDKPLPQNPKLKPKLDFSPQTLSGGRSFKPGNFTPKAQVRITQHKG